MTRQPAAGPSFGLLAALFLCVCATPALAAGLRFEKSAPITQEGVATVGAASGPIAFEQIIVRNLPTAEEIQNAKKDSEDRQHPRIYLVVTNSAATAQRLTATVTLEGDDGKSLMTCDATDVVKAKESSAEMRICWTVGMFTADWPKVRSARVVATIEDAVPTLDKVVPLTNSVADIHEELGRLVVEKVVVGNLPSAADIDKAKRDPTESFHPKVLLFLSNPTDEKIKVAMKVVLENAKGTPYLTCERTDKLDPRTHDDDLTLCWTDSLKTLDWAEVAKAHVLVSIP